MILFWAICAVLIVMALAFILPPLAHPDRFAAVRTVTEANVAVYRGQFAEIESELRHRLITTDQFLQDRDELEQRLIVDLPGDSRVRRTERPAFSSGLLVAALAVALPLTAIFLYLALGAPPYPLPSP